MKWVEHINLTDLWSAYEDDALTFEQVRDQTAERLRASRWGARATAMGYTDVGEQVESLALQDDVEGFNYEFEGLLKLADRDHVWIERMLPARAEIQTERAGERS